MDTAENNREQLLQAGWAAYESLDLPLAERTFQSAIEENPDWFEAWDGLARTYIRMRHVTSASEAIARSIEIGPDRFEGHSSRGMLAFLTDDLAEAQESLSRAVELAPQEAEPHATLAQVLADLGKSKEAQLELDAAREAARAIEDEHTMRLTMASVLHAETYAALAANNERTATEKAQQILSYAEDNPHAACLAYSNLGLMQAQHKRWDQAIEYLERALELNPSFYRARSALGRVYLVTGNGARAAEELGQALEMMPEAEAHTVVAYASALAKSKQRTEAREQYKRALGMKLTWVERLMARWNVIWLDTVGRYVVIGVGLAAVLAWLAFGEPSPQTMTLVLLVVGLLFLQRLVGRR